MADNESALEQFRQQWQSEVSARKKPVRPFQQPASSSRRRPSDIVERPINHPPARHPIADVKDDSDHESVEAGQAGGNSSGLDQRVQQLDLREDADADDFVSTTKANPQTALEHFEKAMEKESSGKLGDSLAHYRKAYRLDAKVDQEYRKKHFPAKSKPINANPSNAAVTVPNPAHHSFEAPSEPLTTPQLIESFAGNRVEGRPPIIAGDKPPPCTIAKLPPEVLVELLHHIGERDPAVLGRLSLVCKALAFQIHTENSIWKAIALGSEFGLAGQQYNFEKDIQGREIVFEDLNDEPLPKIAPPSFASSALYRDVFHAFPRIRFTGVYISTVNYTRPGGASATQFTWSNPIHIITYYRYLRFFRDGSCISLLTTSEPIDVVHHLTHENLSLVRSKGPHHPLNFTSSAAALAPPPAPGRDGVPAPPPSAQNLMKHALKGRWRLVSSSNPATASSLASHMPSENHLFDAGDLHIETEGGHSRYHYTMHLSLKNASRSRTATKNNKLIWKGFWSYNHLTDDWSEFGLKNDKPFIFSRVKSYGLGY